MSLRALTKDQKGFTIIEVMIVLAIAGLIILVVFLAIPALQRNSRNTQRKNDIQALLGGITEWSSNHSGKLPVTPNEVKAAVNNANFGYYKYPDDVFYDTIALSVSSPTFVPLTLAIPKPPTASLPNPTEKDYIFIWSTADCSTNDAPTYVTSRRRTAIQYALETGDGFEHFCEAF